MVEFRSKLNSSKSRALNNNIFKKMWKLYVLITFLFIVIGVVGIIVREDNLDLAVGISLIVLGVLSTPLCYLITLFLRKRDEKVTTFISEDTEEVYTFDEHYITLTQTRNDIFNPRSKQGIRYLQSERG